MDNRHFYHSCTKGLKTQSLFTSAVEFIAGMNRIAICLLQCQAQGRKLAIIAFCLMDNHIHFIFNGSKEDCLYFMERYKHLTCQWISQHRGEKISENIEIGIWLVPDKDKLQDKIIYVIRNAVAAGINFTPQGYRWCSANLMFNDFEALLQQWGKVSDLTKRDARRIFCTRIDVPENWLVSKDGMIWPGHYTEYKFAEKQFGNVKHFMFLQNQTAIDTEGALEELGGNVSIPDGDIKARALEIARTKFGKDSIGRCTGDERIFIAKALKKEYRCNLKQLARIVRIPAETLEGLV